MAQTFIVDINPFTFEVNIIARIKGVEERAEISYDPFELLNIIIIDVNLETFTGMLWLEYDQAVIVRITDSEGIEQRVKLRFSGLK